MRKIFFLFLLVLLSCGTQKVVDYKADGVVIDSTIGDGGLDSIISPYRKSMEEEMNVIIGEASVGLEKYIPESPLGNFSAEAAYLAGLEYGNNHLEIGTTAMVNSFALLNFGGLRAPINQGDITVGNMYELMPFDNMLVLVKISGEKAREMARYLFDQKGQPVYNSSFVLTPDTEEMKIGGKEYQFDKDVIVITTDYLANGGDNMDFFKEPIGYWDTGVFLRDIFIDYVKEKRKLGGYKLTGKIQINN